MAPAAQRVFLSYNFADEAFVERLARHLLTQRPGLETYFYRFDGEAGPWSPQIKRALKKANCCVAIVGAHVGDVQRKELDASIKKRKRILVNLPTCGESARHGFFVGLDPVRVRDVDDLSALECAQKIASYLRHRWLPVDGVPQGYPFEYEKGIVETYRAERRRRADGAAAERVGKGRGAEQSRSSEAQRAHVPVDWPSVFRWSDGDFRPRRNPVSPDTIGTFRGHDARIVVDARLHEANAAQRADGVEPSGGVFLPEAGPRADVVLPTQPFLKVGILVSGGIAPGINAVISGIFHRHQLYASPSGGKRTRGAAGSYDVAVVGFLEGFEALSAHRPKGLRSIELTRELVDEHAHAGGSLISTSRYDVLRDEAPQERQRLLEETVHTLVAQDIQVLYVIGGDGSMRAAHAIFTAARRLGKKISVVGVPKTMDNDILWVWQSFGFLSAVEKAREAILHLHTEVRSNPRLCVVQLFGSDSGFVVAHAVLGTGRCDYALVPEVGFTMATLRDHMGLLLRERRREKNAHGMIVMAETAIPGDVESYIDQPDVGLSEPEKLELRRFVGAAPSSRSPELVRRVPGQTPDALRTAGLKIVSGVLRQHIQGPMAKDDAYWKSFRVVTNEPRHILRSAPPSVQDVIFGQRLGALAVDNALAGYSDFMISQWNTEFVLVPLELVVLGRKRLPPDGIFWKSVLASTGQPAENESHP